MKRQATPCPICAKASERQFRPFCSRDCSDADLDVVRQELTDRIEPLAEELLGAPSSKRRSAWRFGSKGSLEVMIAGHKRGAWISHEAGEGGGPLDLIRHARSCSIADAIAWARSWTGHVLDPGTDYRAEAAERKATRERKAEASAASEAVERAQRIEVARKLAAAATPIAGTVAETYLHRRAILAPASRWPAAVAFHESSRSLILSATLTDGTVQAVQRVRLTADGHKIEATPERPTKQTNGVLDGAAVRLPGDANGPLLLAEGPETGLSVWTATGHETWVALGSIANMQPPAGRRIVAFRDDDLKHSPADRRLLKTVAEWRAAGHQVAIATPWPFRRYDKTDANDALQADGAAAVRRRVEATLHPGGGSPSRQPINQVRQQLRRAVAGFFDEARAFHAQARALPPAPESGAVIGEMDAADWKSVLDAPHISEPAIAEPPVHAIRTDVGSGKTLTSYAEAIRLLTEMRAAGDTRSAAIAVPTHRLGDEQAAIFAVHARGTALTAAVWRGMSAPDPEDPASKMCLNLEAVEDAREAMLPVFESTCRRKLADGNFAMCPFFSSCGYQRQRESSADLWIVPHEMLYMEKPSTIGKLAFLVVDESAWQDGLEGVHGRPTAISLDAIAHVAAIDGTASSMAERLNAERLQFLRTRLIDELKPMAEGPVLGEPLAASDLNAENTHEAYRLEWARFVDPGMHPAMSKAERREAVRKAASNATIPRLAHVWRAVTALLEDGGPRSSGWAALATQPTENGPVRVLHLKSRMKIRRGWQVPTLLIDATLNVDLLRPFWPTVQLTADLLADAPHQTIRQVVDRAFGKSAIEPLAPDHPGYTPDEAKRRAKGLRNVHAIINREARRYGGKDVLVVAQKAAKEALPTFGPMAPCIDLAHHNAVAGRDQWRNVRALFVVGRTQPAPTSVERIAEALTGAAVAPLAGWYQRGDAVRHVGAGVEAIEADRHPDPICEAIRWQICEGELVQIIGRGRGVNRSEDDPLDVLVLTDAPLPMPVADTLQASDLAASPDDLMLAAGGIAFRNPTDAAAAYPQIWATRNAANHTFKRARVESTSRAAVGAKPLLIDTYRGLAPTEPVSYHRAGARLSRAEAVYLPDVVLDPVAKLTELLGPLAWHSLGDPPNDPPAPPSPSATRREPLPDLPPDAADPPPREDGDPGWLPEAEIVLRRHSWPHRSPNGPMAMAGGSPLSVSRPALPVPCWPATGPP